MVRLNCIAMFISITLMCVTAIDRYDDKYDYIDVEALFANQELRESFINCFVETGPCLTEQMKYFKEIIYELLLTRCAKCTDAQKYYYHYGYNWLVKNKPGVWDMIIEKAVEKERGNLGNILRPDF